MHRDETMKAASTSAKAATPAARDLMDTSSMDRATASSNSVEARQWPGPAAGQQTSQGDHDGRPTAGSGSR